MPTPVSGEVLAHCANTLSQEVLVHRINTSELCFGVSTPLFGLQCSKVDDWLYSMYIQHFAKAVFIQSPNSCKKRQFLTLKKQLPIASLFFCFGPLRGNPVDPPVPTLCQHCANTVPTPVWPRCWHVPTPFGGQVLGKKCANVGTPTLAISRRILKYAFIASL